MQQRLITVRRTCAVILRSRWDQALVSRLDRVSTSTVVISVAREECGARKVGFGRYAGWSYAKVLANDPAYCTWVLKTAGSESSPHLCDFAAYLTAAHHGHNQGNVGGDVGMSAGDEQVAFGKYIGCTFAEVSMKHPDYCAWVLKAAVSESSSPLRDFAAFLSAAKEDAADKIQIVPTASSSQMGCGSLDDLVWKLRAIVKLEACACAPVGSLKLAQITQLFNDICRVFRMDRSLTPFHISQAAWAAAKLHVYDEDLFNNLASAVLLKVWVFEAIHIAKTCWAFASFGRSDEKVFSSLAVVARAKMGSFSQQGLANTAGAYATVGRSDAELSSAVVRAAVVNIKTFGAQSITIIAWAFAKVGRSDRELFSSLASAAVAKIDGFDEQNIAKTAWAFATAGRSDAELFSALAAAAVAKINGFNSLDIANTAWAFATAGRGDGELFLALAAAAVAKIDSFSEQGIANTAWAFATVGRSDMELFSALAAAAVAQINRFTPIGIANTAWAFAKVDIGDGELFSALAVAAVAQIDGFSEQGIANTAWAFATVRRSDMELFSALAAAAVAQINGFIPQNIANTAWAFAKVGRSDGELFSALAVSAVAKIDSFDEQTIANTAWAFAAAGVSDADLFSALAAAAVAKIESFNPQGIANTAWAFARVGRSDDVLFSKLANAAILLMSENKFTSEHGLGHLAWAFVHVDLRSCPLREALFAAVVRHASLQGWARLRSEFGPVMSKIESVCAEIVSDRFPHALISQNRYLLGFELDIVVEDSNYLINIEIDGPTHDNLRQRCIDTRRDALLQRLGIRVVRVDLKTVSSQAAHLEHALVVALRGRSV